MAEGIVVKVWNVTAKKGERSGASQVASSIHYIENPEKVAVRMDESMLRQVETELHYVMNEMKTMEGLYVGGRRIADVQNATNEMMQVKQFFGKMDGRVALHGVVSLDKDESDPRNAGKLMLLLDEVMAEVFPKNQVVYAVHTNTEHLHIHFILNTVGLDGKKIHMDHTFMKHVLQPSVNEKALKYGFTPNPKWKREYETETIPLSQRKHLLSKLIDHAIEQTDDFASFIAYLRKDGLQVNVGKQISLQCEGMAYPMRTGRLGTDYTIDGICRRIAAKREPLVWKEVGTHSHYLSEKEMLFFTPDKMKRYQDMTVEEKERAIRLLKLQRNPWEELREQNWQIQKMGQQLNKVGFVYELVHFYSRGKDCASTALDEIKARRIALSKEKKEIVQNLKNNKDLVLAYEAIQKHMRNAYLFDAFGRTEYSHDFQQYLELSQKLEYIYGKTVEEAGAFIVDQRNQLMYARAQDKELKQQYTSIKHYVEHGWFQVDESVIPFYRAVGHSEAKRNAREYGIYTSDIKYITSKEVEGILVRVMTMPDIVDGKATVTTTVTVWDQEENVLTEIHSKEMDAKAFQEAIFAIAKEYGFRECQISKKPIRRNI